MKHDRNLQLFGSVTETSSNLLAVQLRTLDATSSKPISLWINSDGGDVVSAFMLYDTIRLLRSPVHGYVVGRAYSCAVLVFQACDRRMMAPNAYLMFHPDTTEVASTSLKEAISDLATEAEQSTRFNTLIAERSGASLEDILSLESRVTYLDATQCKKQGFTDVVMKPRKKLSGNLRRGTRAKN